MLPSQRWTRQLSHQESSSSPPQPLASCLDSSLPPASCPASGECFVFVIGPLGDPPNRNAGWMRIFECRHPFLNLIKSCVAQPSLCSYSVSAFRSCCCRSKISNECLKMRPNELLTYNYSLTTSGSACLHTPPTSFSVSLEMQVHWFS